MLRASLLEPFLLFNLFSYNLHLTIKKFCLKQNLRKCKRRRASTTCRLLGQLPSTRALIAVLSPCWQVNQHVKFGLGHTVISKKHNEMSKNVTINTACSIHSNYSFLTAEERTVTHSFQTLVEAAIICMEGDNHLNVTGRTFQRTSNAPGGEARTTV
jgi:hypothetical protein